MLLKAVLITVIGGLSVNALTVPVARAPEPESELPRLFSAVYYHNLTSIPFDSFGAMG